MPKTPPKTEVAESKNSSANSQKPTNKKVARPLPQLLVKCLAAAGLMVWTASVFVLVQAGLFTVVGSPALAGFIANTNHQVVVTVVLALSYALTIAIVALVPWLVAPKLSNRPSRKLFGFSYLLPRWRDVGLAPLVWLACLLTASGLAIALRLFLPGIDLDQQQNLPFSPDGVFTRSDMAWIYITIAVLAPLGEEILFRGYLFERLRRFLPATATVIITAVVFGLMHIVGFNEDGSFRPQINVVIATTVIGIGLGMLREYTGSVWAGIFTHMLQNTIAFFVLYVASSMV